MLISFSPAYSDADFARAASLPKTTPLPDWIKTVVEPALRAAISARPHSISAAFKIQPMKPLSPAQFKTLLSQIGALPHCIPYSSPPPSPKTLLSYLLSFWNFLLSFFRNLFYSRGQS